MSLIRYSLPDLWTQSPVNRLAAFHNEVNRFFDFPSASAAFSVASDSAPALDVYESETRYTVQVALPGWQKDELKIALHDGELTISGERTSDEEAQKSVGSFRRSLTLPGTVDPAKVQATYRDGILQVELAKTEAAKPKKIEIGVS